MAKFRVKYFGSNDVPVDLIKPILDEIDAELVIARPTNDAEVIEMGRDADGIIMHGAVPFTKEIISQLKKTKVVCRTGVGVDRMDLAAAEEFGIKVCNAAGCNSIEVSEQAIGLLIAISRKLMRMNQYVHDGKWRRHTAELHRYRGRVYRITGCTMGIVGLGHVGKQVAPRAQGMKLNVQTYDPYLDPKIAARDGCKDGFVRRAGSNLRLHQLACAADETDPQDVQRAAVQSDEEYRLSHQLRPRRSGGFRCVV